MVETAMTLLTHHGEGPAFPYDGQPPGFAAMELTIPGRFGGPIPHAHDEFDEAIYVLRGGQLLVVGEGEPQQAIPGSMFVEARGHRQGFSNPSDEPARVLGVWAPAEPALSFMRDIGSAPDPNRMREIYARPASRLLP
jgi:quercetin dioxygenase-like cupin family protein